MLRELGRPRDARAAFDEVVIASVTTSKATYTNNMLQCRRIDTFVTRAVLGESRTWFYGLATWCDY
jgi:hypothetical protein